MMKNIMMVESALMMMLLASIPKAIFDLSDDAIMAEKEETLESPRKLVVVPGFSCLLLLFSIVVYTIIETDVVYMFILNVAMSIYFMVYGLLLGVLTKTLVTRCKQIGQHGEMYLEGSVLDSVYVSLKVSHFV